MAVPNRDEVGDLLTTRRATVRPDRVDVPTAGSRVPGLRRAEVAMLAGISVEYYARLEQATSPAYPTPSWTRSLAPSTSRRRT
jgi:hypothetical protein